MKGIHIVLLISAMIFTVNGFVAKDPTYIGSVADYNLLLELVN